MIQPFSIHQFISSLTSNLKFKFYWTNWPSFKSFRKRQTNIIRICGNITVNASLLCSFWFPNSNILPRHSGRKGYKIWWTILYDSLSMFSLPVITKMHKILIYYWPSLHIFKLLENFDMYKRRFHRRSSICIKSWSVFLENKLLSTR